MKSITSILGTTKYCETRGNDKFLIGTDSNNFNCGTHGNVQLHFTCKDFPFWYWTKETKKFINDTTGGVSIIDTLATWITIRIWLYQRTGKIRGYELFIRKINLIIFFQMNRQTLLLTLLLLLSLLIIDIRVVHTGAMFWQKFWLFIPHDAQVLLKWKTIFLYWVAEKSSLLAQAAWVKLDLRYMW